MKLKAIVSSVLAVGALTTCYAVVESECLAIGCKGSQYAAVRPPTRIGPRSAAISDSSRIRRFRKSPRRISKSGSGMDSARLGRACNHADRVSRYEHWGQQTSPIAVDGVVYSETPDGDVIAVDGATGAVKWKWHPTVANSGFGPTGTRRGLSVGGGRVYTLAAGNRVVALDQNTGAQIWAVMPDSSRARDDPRQYRQGRDDVLQRQGLHRHERCEPQRLFALDAATGAMPGLAVLRRSQARIRWSPMSTARRGMPATPGCARRMGSTPCPAGTPQNTCALTAGASPWIHGAIDPALNMFYLAFGNVRSCGSSQDASGRPGTNLFSNSLVALDATTGAYKWHFQSNLHGQWDMDNTTQSDDGRRDHQWPAEKGDLSRHQAGQDLRARSHQRLAGAARRVQDRRAGLAPEFLADATLPGRASASLASGLHRVPESGLGDPGSRASRGAQLQRVPGRARPGQPRPVAVGLQPGELHRSG